MGFSYREYLPVVLVVLLCGNAAAETRGSGTPVKVLVYNSARVPESVLEHAGLEAARIFRAAGVTLVWVNCSGRGADSALCRVVPDRNQFILHIVAKGRTSTDSVYGEAFLAADGSGKYADVFFDRVEGAHRDFGTNVSQLLGTVAAHELGHLLLGLNAHSWRGIMLPVWKGEILRRVDMGVLLFNREEAFRIQVRVGKDGVSLADLKTKAVAY